MIAARPTIPPKRTRRTFCAAFVVFALSLTGACAFLGIPGFREYTAAQARSVLEGALEESILLASLTGSTDERNGARLLQNILLQKRALESGVILEDGKVYLREDVDACADRIRSTGFLFGVVTTPEAVVLPAADCNIRSQ